MSVCFARSYRPVVIPVPEAYYCSAAWLSGKGSIFARFVSKSIAYREAIVFWKDGWHEVYSWDNREHYLVVRNVGPSFLGVQTIEKTTGARKLFPVFDGPPAWNALRYDLPDSREGLFVGESGSWSVVYEVPRSGHCPHVKVCKVDSRGSHLLAELPLHGNSAVFQGSSDGTLVAFWLDDNFATRCSAIRGESLLSNAQDKNCSRGPATKWDCIEDRGLRAFVHPTLTSRLIVGAIEGNSKTLKAAILDVEANIMSLMDDPRFVYARLSTACMLSSGWIAAGLANFANGLSPSFDGQSAQGLHSHKSTVMLVNSLGNIISLNARMLGLNLRLGCPFAITKSGRVYCEGFEADRLSALVVAVPE